MTDTPNKYLCPRCGTGEEREAVPADQVQLIISPDDRDTMRDAVDLIQSQAARIERLEAALKPFVRAVDYCEELNHLKPGKNSRYHDFVISDEFRAAHKALQESQP